MNTTVRRAQDVGELFIGAIVGALVAFVGLKVIATVDWPSFNSSNVTRALTTVGQVVAVAALVLVVLLNRYRSGRSSTGSPPATTCPS